jgi:hypothetical protein
MLIEPKLIERLADILEGIPVSHASSQSSAQAGGREASILVYHAGHITEGPVAGESPLLEISISETDSDCSVMVNSALGMVELHGVDEVRLLEATEEAAFFSHGSRQAGSQQVSMLTISSRGVIQVYMNVSKSLEAMELGDVSDRELRAAVALKVFSEQAEVFRAA